MLNFPSCVNTLSSTFKCVSKSLEKIKMSSTYVITFVHFMDPSIVSM